MFLPVSVQGKQVGIFLIKVSYTLIVAQRHHGGCLGRPSVTHPLPLLTFPWPVWGFKLADFNSQPCFSHLLFTAELFKFHPGRKKGNIIEER